MMATHASKERVLKALHREEPDRVPRNYMANPDINARLYEHFGIPRENRERFLQRLGVDFRGVDAPYVGPKLHEDLPGRQVDMWGIRRRWVEHASGGYWDFCDFPLEEATEEQVAAWPMPNPDHFDYDQIREGAERHQAFAVFAGNAGTGDLLNSTGMIRNYEQVLVDVVTDDPAGLLYMDRKVEIQLEILRRSLEAAKGRIDFVWLGEDLGTQDRPLISLETYRKHLRPRHQKFVDLAKTFDLPVMIHTCGSSSWAYDDFCEMGVDAVDTLQPEVRDMSPGYLKERFGNRLAFHGCISTAGALANGTVDDVRRCVRETLDIMMPGGGYCLAPTHMIQDNTPTENVLALYEAADAFGEYA